MKEEFDDKQLEEELSKLVRDHVATLPVDENKVIHVTDHILICKLQDLIKVYNVARDQGLWKLDPEHRLAIIQLPNLKGETNG